MRLTKLQKNNYIDFALRLFDNYNHEIVQNTIDNAYADFKEKGGKDWVAWNTFMFVHRAVRCTALKIFGGENDKFYAFMDQYNSRNIHTLTKETLKKMESKGFNCYLKENNII